MKIWTVEEKGHNYHEVLSFPEKELAEKKFFEIATDIADEYSDNSFYEYNTDFKESLIKEGKYEPHSKAWVKLEEKEVEEVPSEFNDLFIKENCVVIYDAKELLLAKNRNLDEDVADTIYQSEGLHEKLVESFEKKKLTNVVLALENDNISILELADCITAISSQITVESAENVLGGYVSYNIPYIVDVEKMKKLCSAKY